MRLFLCCHELRLVFIAHFGHSLADLGLHQLLAAFSAGLGIFFFLFSNLNFMNLPGLFVVLPGRNICLELGEETR